MCDLSYLPGLTNHVRDVPTVMQRPASNVELVSPLGFEIRALLIVVLTLLICLNFVLLGLG